MSEESREMSLYCLNSKKKEKIQIAEISIFIESLLYIKYLEFQEWKKQILPALIKHCDSKKKTWNYAGIRF